MEVCQDSSSADYVLLSLLSMPPEKKDVGQAQLYIRINDYRLLHFTTLHTVTYLSGNTTELFIITFYSYLIDIAIYK